MSFSWSVVTTISLFLFWIFCRFVKTLFNKIFNDNTITEREIQEFVRAKSLDPTLIMNNICLESSNDIDFSIIIKCQSTDSSTEINRIREIRNRFNINGYNKERTEVIFIFDVNGPIVKNVHDILINEKNIRFLKSSNDPFQEFRRCVLMAHGKYIINSHFIEDELPELKSYPKSFMVIAKPVKKEKSFYDPLTFAFPIFATKGSSLILYTRVHLDGVEASPELAKLCILLNVPLYVKTYPIKSINIGVFNSIYNLIIKYITQLLYKYHIWTPNKQK